MSCYGMFYSKEDAKTFADKLREKGKGCFCKSVYEDGEYKRTAVHPATQEDYTEECLKLGIDPNSKTGKYYLLKSAYEEGEKLVCVGEGATLDWDFFEHKGYLDALEIDTPQDAVAFIYDANSSIVHDRIEFIERKERKEEDDGGAVERLIMVTKWGEEICELVKSNYGFYNLPKEALRIPLDEGDEMKIIRVESEESLKRETEANENSRFF